MSETVKSPAWPVDAIDKINEWANKATQQSIRYCELLDKHLALKESLSRMTDRKQMWTVELIQETLREALEPSK